MVCSQVVVRSWLSEIGDRPKPRADADSQGSLGTDGDDRVLIPTFVSSSAPSFLFVIIFFYRYLLRPSVY